MLAFEIEDGGSVVIVGSERDLLQLAAWLAVAARGADVAPRFELSERLGGGTVFITIRRND